VAAVAVLVALAVQPAVSSAAQKVIESPGSPLGSIFIDEDLGCQVQAAGDSIPSFFAGTEPGACGTFIGVTKDEEIEIGEEEGRPLRRLFGPSVPLGPAPNADFEPISQSSAGNGAETVVSTSEFVVETPEETPEKAAELTETDRYVTGQDFYTTTITITNLRPVQIEGTLYHAGDCVLGGEDAGFGAANVPAAGSTACTATANNSPAVRLMAFTPTAGPTPNFVEGEFATVWSGINERATAFPNTVDATTFEDNGMGLSWPISLAGAATAPGGKATVTFTTTITPFVAPAPPPCTTPLPTVSITSDQGHSSYGIGDAASVTIAAAGVGITSDPSAAHVPISTATPGTFSVARSATGPCGTSAASFSYTVIPPPVLGRTVNVNVVSGKVFVAVPTTGHASLAGRFGDATESLSKGLKFVPLQEARQIPVGSILNTSAGVARVTTATASKGKLQFGDFGAGIFKLLQRRQQRGLTELDVMNAHSARQVCATLGKSAVAAKHLSSKVLGRLTGSAHGRFTTRGQFSAATVRGTIWGVRNRCDGTLTRVTRGVVSVRDFHRRKTITLVTGQSYLARAPGH
jgi:hypothetical protein